MKKVMVFGTFDILHEGHLHLFRQAKAQGDYLIVVVGRDATVKAVKGVSPEHDEAARQAAIVKCGLADKVILGYLGDKYKIIKEEKPDIIALGYDQQAFTADLHHLNIPIVHISAFHPEKYKSSLLKKQKK